MSPSRLAACLTLALLPACMSAEDAQNALAAVRDDAPDELPVPRNAELPFHYPPELFERQVEGEVTLRIYIDSLGAVRPESTTVAEPSGHPALDSAAVLGARALRFAPARRAGAPVGVAVLFPVHFRHPEKQETGDRRQETGELPPQLLLPPISYLLSPELLSPELLSPSQ